ncbi:MAG: hypothetical protein CMP12_17295 [Zunongwangia sp.]|uniref:DUF5018 domain-containing protein n=2 Tax=Zunongwangia profunda TaxID=398743 RepID=UPI000C96BEDE|nr:DUF5018 domain-containing protein [Zunongwangia profunda]MAO37629.1 hypothetical protein [Zunongwangia sp.]MCC4230420.1 DUF5018 domain-containing protein [Zunongwangia profunda]
MKKTFSIIFAFIAIALTSCSSDDDNAVQPSSLAEITDFSLTFNNVNESDINYDLGTNITVSVPFGTSLEDIIPNIAISEGATITPASGEQVDFVDGEAKTFTVTAEDGTEKEYTVTVNVRGEVGSGTKLKTYTVVDLFFGTSVKTYSYNEANFVSEISEEIDGTETTVSSFVYDDKNQVIALQVEAKNEETTYTYEDGKIVGAETTIDDNLVFTYEYIYNENGDLAIERRIDHTDDDDLSENKFVYENGNVIEENQYGLVSTAEYDDKNNPFIELYPSAYAAINVGIQSVNQNNPISGTLADDTIPYEYNEDGYPVSASYSYYDGAATVDKTFTYYAE